jgi:hypothetical protein
MNFLGMVGFVSMALSFHGGIFCIMTFSLMLVGSFVFSLPQFLRMTSHKFKSTL